MDAEAWNFDCIAHPVLGANWANYHLVDPDSKGDENFTHMVSVAPSNVFQMDPGVQVQWSTLGIDLIFPPCVMYWKDLTQYGQDVVSKFASAFIQAKNPEMMAMAEVTVAAGPVGTITHPEDVTMQSDSSSKTKATDKCQIKSSAEEQSVSVDDSHGEASVPAPVTKAGPVISHRPEEMEGSPSVTTVTGGGNTANEPLLDMQMLNQVREMVFCLFNQFIFSSSVRCRCVKPSARPCIWM